ncbi:L-type lectin-domain containing receptor kinase S.6 [Humulus lupulus]|uniref:L-type lectin-domain containing receptor kinase S.6 n=1 Tax=Humulus lupulus TaxID=3486 RepID=UPI002B4014A2|nr:L-type lectin-domain containing receptor kinase S.6 [Humulus lupulus]
MTLFSSLFPENSSEKTTHFFTIMHSPHSLLIWVIIFIISFFNLHFPSFSHPPNNKNITLFGDAFFRNSSITLTQELSACLSSSSSSSSTPSSAFYGVGGALYANPIRFVDSETNDTVSFSSVFSFSISTSPLCSSGDGISFLIAPNDDSFSSSKGHIGLPRPAFDFQDSFFAVEYDTSFDPLLGDINGNHIGIDLNSVVSVTSVDITPRGVDLTSGKVIRTWIEYRNPMKMIRVWIGYSPVRPPNPSLVARIDLSSLLKEFMYVGFSSSNGQGSALHVVDKWRFKIFHSSLVPMDTVEEGDCFICSPEDSVMENNNESFFDGSKLKVGEIVLGVGGLSAFVVSIFAIVVVISFIKIKKRKLVAKTRVDSFARRIQTNRVPARLSLEEIKSATMGFDRNRIVGEGASATVYKGSLPYGEVAVKRFQRVSGIDCWRNPFTTEFATMVGCLRHKNLIQLQGWCCEGSELVLVYEYMSNGSLDKVLHKKTKSAIVLSWMQRLNIVLGVASALAYLHEECERQIIHRDVKACNIMLDEEFNAKLGDFGLAEVYEHSAHTRNATIPAGTMGYLAPEYVYSGVPTSKTDVYSFGVVVLELVTGRRPVDEHGTAVVDWAWDMWQRGKLIDAADVRLKGKVNSEELMRMLIVGLACVHPNHVKRPTINEAARILKGEAPLPVLPARKPKLRLRPVMPESSEEAPSYDGDRARSASSDDPPFLTPRSNFS